MKIFNKDTKKIAYTLIIVLCLLRLIEIEENQLAKILEILLTIFRILSTLDSIISNTKSADVNIDDTTD
ncbi:MAG: hypothetical protein ACRYE9_00115 [Janthinobacterium lividum]